MVAGPVDDGATPALAQDGAVILPVLQLAVLQEKPASNSAGSEGSAPTATLASREACWGGRQLPGWVDARVGSSFGPAGRSHGPQLSTGSEDKPQSPPP